MKARILSYLVAVVVIALRMTIRVRFYNDPREELRCQRVPYLFSFLHAHQLALMIGREKGTGAMVSRSRDGELIVALLKMLGLVPVRGSSRTRPGSRGERGGMEALQTLNQHVLSGHPVAIAVDGPRGPRGRVHKGIALLSQQTGAPVLNLVAIAPRKWTITKAWDRMQIPMPFSTVSGYFAEPIYPVAGEKLEAYRRRIEAGLLALEQQFEPGEAIFNVQPLLGDVDQMTAAGVEDGEDEMDDDLSDAAKPFADSRRQSQNAPAERRANAA